MLIADLIIDTENKGSNSTRSNTTDTYGNMVPCKEYTVYVDIDANMDVYRYRTKDNRENKE